MKDFQGKLEAIHDSVERLHRKEYVSKAEMVALQKDIERIEKEQKDHYVTKFTYIKWLLLVSAAVATLVFAAIRTFTPFFNSVS